jgi:hypothetical protein
MYRIDNSTAALSLPMPGAATGVNGYFTLGNPAGGVPATIVDQDWANAVQEELCNAVTGAGITLSKTSRNQLSTAIGDLIAVETSRAETAEALLAPKANPIFSGNGSIVGSFTVGTQVTATGVIESTSTSGSAIQAPNGGVYAAALTTTGSGSAAIGTGGLTNSGSESVAGNITSTGGNITSSTGTVTGVNVHFTGELYGPSFTVTGGALSGGTGSFSGTLYSGGQISNPWFYSNGSYLYTSVNLLVGAASTLGGAVVCNGGLTVNGAQLIATDSAVIYGSLSVTNGSAIGGWQCYDYGAGGNPALVADVGLVAASFGFTATAGYALTSSGTTAYSSFSGQFAFASGSGALQGLAFYATSDIRLKENLAPITPDEGIAFIKNVTPTAFDWKEDGQHGTGYIAQELVAKGYTHLVLALPDDRVEEETHEYDDVTVTSQKGVKMIAKYDDVIALQHAAILSLVSRIEALEARLG